MVGRLGWCEGARSTGSALAALADTPTLDRLARRKSKYGPAPLRDPDSVVGIAVKAVTEYARGSRDLVAHRARRIGDGGKLLSVVGCPEHRGVQPHDE